MNMEETKTIILLLISIIGLAFAAQKFLFDLFSHTIKKYELYSQIRELCGSNANENLAQIRVALDTITTRELSPKEIEWFLYTPNAFRYLKRYGRNTRYVEIDFETNKFCYKPRVATLGGRLKEKLKLLTIYVVCGVTGIVVILNNESLSNAFGFIPLFGLNLIGVFLGVFALGALYVSQLFQNSADMINSKLPE